MRLQSSPRKCPRASPWPNQQATTKIDDFPSLNPDPFFLTIFLSPISKAAIASASVRGLVSFVAVALATVTPVKSREAGEVLVVEDCDLILG